MAQQTHPQPGTQRIPMMSASMLEDRTRPLVQEPVPIWLRHRLRRRHAREAAAASNRARGLLDRLARR